MNYDIKILDDEPTDSIWAMITKQEKAAIEADCNKIYDITIPSLRTHKGLTVTGIQMREWMEPVKRFSCDIYYLMKK